jgi:hypothetical protein
MAVDSFGKDARFEFFGPTEPRDHALCPHCGKQGNKIDEGTIAWGDNAPSCKDSDYVCSVCSGEWIIRIYKYTGFEKHSGPHSAAIYIPGSTKWCVVCENRHVNNSGRVCSMCQAAHERQIDQEAYTHYGSDNWEDGWETNEP